MRSDDPADAIDLAHTPDFRLGGIAVRPSSREIECKMGREILEPRVMQVLVALAEAGGAVVSREDLVRRCWDGRSVGEDAINRCIAKLRRIAESGDTHSYTIDTIPRVGYRLVLTDTAPSGLSLVVAPSGSAVPSVTPQQPAGRWNKTALLRSGAIGFGVIAMAAVGLIAARSIMFPKHWVIESARPIVATPLIERHPALSPDGTMLVYSSGKDVFTRQLYLVRLAGGDPIRLTSDDYDHVAANWSRDGSRIVYVAVKTGEPCHLLIMPVPSGVAREVGRCLSEERSRADWDISGQAIYFADRPAKGATSRIYKLDIATGRRSEVTHPPEDSMGDAEPAVSPDGRLIGFLRYRNEADVGVSAYDLSSGSVRILYPRFSSHEPSWAWAENSSDVLVSEQRNFVLRRHFADGTDLDLFTSPLEIGRISRGPNGLLAAEMNTYRSNLATPPAEPGGAPVFIDPANNQTMSLSFAPDGTLAMASNRSGEDAIWLMPPGKPASQLVSFGQAKLMGPAFSPDGQSIAAVIAAQGTTTIRIFSAAGTQLASIPAPWAQMGEPQWLPDSKGLVFTIRDREGSRVVRLDLAKPTSVTPVTGYGWNVVRLRGTEMFGTRDDQPGIWQITSTPRLITSKLPLARSMQWKIRGDDIIFVDGSDRQHLRLRAQPIAGGPDRVFAETPRLGDDSVNGETGEFAINPKTGQIVYTSAVQVDTDIHLLRIGQR
jgi:DNA-binding winged helix-turn-helix (wHTH) protein/WD40 repeat protein